MSAKSCSTKLRDYALAALAAAAALALVLTAAPRRTRAESILFPATSTIQGRSVCGTAPGTNNVLNFTGTNWCDTATPTLSSLTLNGGGTLLNLSGSGSKIVYNAGQQLLFSDGTNVTLNINSTNWAFTHIPIQEQKGIDFAPNGTEDATITFAPRSVFGSPVFNIGSLTNTVVMAVTFPQPATFDNMRVTWASYSCTTAPTVLINDSTAAHAVGSFQLNATSGGDAAVTLTNASVAAGDEIQLKVGALACATPPVAVGVAGAYHMQ